MRQNETEFKGKIVCQLKFASELAPHQFEAVSPKAVVDLALKSKFLSITVGDIKNNKIIDPRPLLSETVIDAGERKFGFAVLHFEVTNPDTGKVTVIAPGVPNKYTPLLNGNEILQKMSELVPVVRAANVAETLTVLQSNPDLLNKFRSIAILGETKHGFAISARHFSHLPADCKLGLHWFVPVVTP